MTRRGLQEDLGVRSLQGALLEERRERETVCWQGVSKGKDGNEVRGQITWGMGGFIGLLGTP